ncbi:MAG: DedA family protein [Planctomycetes bacterium]|nr:DedA family protein [Planctomycetota bacterium]
MNDHPEITPDDRASAESAVVVSRWALHRHLYDWVLSFAHRPHATTVLFLLSFAESSFFPIPPDVLLAPLCLGHRRKSLWFATVTTVGSVLGGVGGYAIGHFVGPPVVEWMYTWVPGFSPHEFERVQSWYEHWGVWVLFAAAFTPIPFKVFTIAGGVFAQPLGLFVGVSLIGRAMRFFMVAGLFYWIGPKALPFIDKYFNWLCLAFVALLVAGFAIIKML